MSNSNVFVTRNASESTPNLIRRFQKRVQESGVLPRVRGVRYASRPQSPLKQKNARLRKLKKTKEYETLKRLGKVVERKRRR